MQLNNDVGHKGNHVADQAGEQDADEHDNRHADDGRQRHHQVLAEGLVVRGLRTEEDEQSGPDIAEADQQ